MEHKTAPLFLLSVLALVILVSGCTGNLDPQALAATNSMIKQFMNDHPNAKIVVTHFTAEQAKNMIGQIRSECDNPYLDEKEFYRVNITDPETNFFAIVWIDWNTKTIECAFKLGTEGKTVEKPVPANCTAHEYSKCYNGHIYWFDSCGNKQEKKEYCQYGCSEKQCLGECKSNVEYRCYGDNVYWFDSCGNKQEQKEYCQYGCENGFCKTKPTEKTCEEAGGYCIWPNTATSPSGGGGGGVSEGQAICEKKCAASNIKFAAVWTDKETYSTGDTVKFFAKLIDNNGGPATPEQGNKVYFFGISPASGPLTSSVPINYNYSSGYYEYATTPIPSNADPGTWIFYATAENNESFVGSENVYVKINPTASSASSPSVPTQYTGCIGQCLLRFMAASPATAIISPSASSASGGTSTPTGMIVATEITATSKIVSYQCQTGYEVGKYFCREGGICCVPKIAPPPSTEFCGSSTQGPCASDSECITGGCSGQVCQSIKEQSVPTTCEYRDCYNADKFGMACKCEIQSITPAATAAIIGEPSIQGRCKWTKAETIGYCKDSDGGKNYYVKGIVIGNDVDGGSLQLNDVCEGNYVHEYFCQEPNPNGNYLERQNYGWVNYPCPYGCKDGACIQTPSVKILSPTGETWLIGNSYTISWKAENAPSDSWVGIIRMYKDKMFLFDVVPSYSKNPSSGYVYYQVPVNSVTGSNFQVHIVLNTGPVGSESNIAEAWSEPFSIASSSQACTDSDGGKNYYTFGFTTGIDEVGNQGSQNDFCCTTAECHSPVNTGSYLSENYCDGSISRRYEYQCPYGCSNGACIQQPNQICTDSDGGKNYYVKGTARYNTQTESQGMSDRCINVPGYPQNATEVSSCQDSNCFLNEVDCVDGNPTAHNYQCPNGCSNGACIQPAQTCVVDATQCSYNRSLCGKEYYQEAWNGTANELQKTCVITETSSTGTTLIPSTWTFKLGPMHSECANIIECPNGCSNGACIQ